MSGQRAKNNSQKHYAVVIASLLFVFYLINGIAYLRCQSITSDEGPYYNYAQRFIKGHPEKAGHMIDDSKMPVVVLNLMPRIIQQWLHPGLKKNDEGESDIIMGRYVTLFVSVLTILLVYKWATQLYGATAALFAAFLMVFCPNNTASAGLVTTDSYSVLSLLTVVYCTWKFCVTRKNKYFILLCCAVALAQLIKQTLVHLYMLVPICIVVYRIMQGPSLNVRSLLTYAVVFGVINWFIINAGFYFYQTNTALGSYHFVSRPFQLLQHILPSWLPVPLPKPFVNGWDMVKHNNDVGGGYPSSTFGKVTILGHASANGFWYYYLVSVFFKTPISYFIFVVCALWLMVKRNSFKMWMGHDFFLMMPVLYFFIILSFTVKIQTGMRHIIFIYPFLFIFSASIIPHVKSLFSKIGVVAVSLFLVISVLHYWRNYYPYTNEFVSDKKMAYNYVGADNLDYKQGGYFYKDYLAKHPAMHWVPLQPTAGTFLITTKDYLDVWNTRNYNWITAYRPLAQVAYSGLVIEVPENSLSH